VIKIMILNPKSIGAALHPRRVPLAVCSCNNLDTAASDCHVTHPVCAGDKTAQVCVVAGGRWGPSSCMHIYQH
jgi:hypothetical protein